MISPSERAALRDELERLLFGAGELPRGTSDMQTLNGLSAARAREASGGAVLGDPGFAWFLIVHAVRTAPKQPERVEPLIAARHLLVLGDYDDERAAEREIGTTLERFYALTRQDKSGVKSNAETLEEFLTRRKGARQMFAAHASRLGTFRRTFQSSSPHRLPVAGALRDQLVALLDSKPTMRKLWKQYEYERADGDEGRFMPAAKGGWGPPRNTWLHGLRPDHPVLNSRDDHPQLGDTTSFFRVAEVDEAGQLLTIPTSNIVVEPGRTYRGMIWVSNDADPKHADATARNVRVRVKGEGRFTGSARLSAELRADNIEQAVIWDSSVIALPEPDSAVALRVVPNSAALWATGGTDNRTPLDAHELFKDEGVLIGHDGRADGVLPPEQDKLAVVTFDFVLDKPDFTLTLAARPYLPGQEQREPYRERIELEPGEVIEMRVNYRNTGAVQQDNVRLELLKLPKAFHYYGNTIEICNSKTGGDWKTFTPDPDSFGYYLLGSYAPGGECLVRFRIKAQKASLYDYGQGIYWPVTDRLVRIFTDNGSKSAGITMVLFSNTRPLRPHAEDRS